MATVHKHLLMSGNYKSVCDSVNTEIQYLTYFLHYLIGAIGMKILIEPNIVYCNTENNEGITGFACIDTSHVSFHLWDHDLSFKFDLYSCTEFDAITVVDMVAKAFDADKGTLRAIVIDRNTNELLERIA